MFKAALIGLSLVVGTAFADGPTTIVLEPGATATIQASQEAQVTCKKVEPATPTAQYAMPAATQLYTVSASCDKIKPSTTSGGYVIKVLKVTEKQCGTDHYFLVSTVSGVWFGFVNRTDLIPVP